MSLNIKQMANMKMLDRTSPAVQWLRLCASTSGGMGSTLGLGAKLPQDSQQGPTNKQKKKDMKVLDNRSDEKM